MHGLLADNNADVPAVTLVPVDHDPFATAVITAPSGSLPPENYIDAEGHPHITIHPRRDVPPDAVTGLLGGYTPAAKRTFDQFMQGATGNFSDEVTDPLGAVLATAVNDPKALLSGDTSNQSLADALSTARGDTQKELADEEKNHALPSMIAKGVGSILPLVAAGGANNALNFMGTAPSFIEKLAMARPQAARAIAGSLAGAGGAGVYGAGEGQGDAGARLPHALYSAGWGVPMGIGGAYLAQGLSGLTSAARELLASRFGNDAANLFHPPAAQPASDAVDLRPSGLLAAPQVAALQEGKTLPMLAGDRTQNTDLQALEDQALRQGDPRMLAARSQQQDAAYAPFQNTLAPQGGLIGTPDEIAAVGNDTAHAQTAADLIRQQYDALGGQVNAAYKTAGELGEGVGISADAVKGQFLNSVDQFLAEEAYKPGDIPQLDDHISDIEDILKPEMEDGKPKATVTSLKLKQLEAWKKRLNRTIDNTQNKGDLRLLKQVGRKYDEFMTNLADDAIINGDAKAIKAFKDARGLAAKKFKFYDSDKVITRIIDNRDLSGSQLANIIYGAGKVSGKGDDGRIAETMLNLAGEHAPQMQDAIKRGIMARILERSQSKTLDPVQSEKQIDRYLISFPKLVDNLGELVNRQPETFKAVFSDQEQEFLKQFLKEARQLGSRQPGAINNSNTWTLLAKYLNKMPLIGHTPWGFGLQKLATMHLEHNLRGKAAKGLDEFIPKVIHEIDAPPAFYGGAMMGAVSTFPDQTQGENDEE